jgi:DNA-binding protein Alba
MGGKPPINYVLGIITGFSGSNAEEDTLKARGQAINTAVDTVEVTRHRFMEDLRRQNSLRNRRNAAERSRKQSNDGFNDRNHVDTLLGNS